MNWVCYPPPFREVKVVKVVNLGYHILISETLKINMESGTGALEEEIPNLETMMFRFYVSFQLLRMQNVNHESSNLESRKSILSAFLVCYLLASCGISRFMEFHASTCRLNEKNKGPMIFFRGKGYDTFELWNFWFVCLDSKNTSDKLLKVIRKDNTIFGCLFFCGKYIAEINISSTQNFNDQWASPTDVTSGMWVMCFFFLSLVYIGKTRNTMWYENWHAKCCQLSFLWVFFIRILMTNDGLLQHG